MICRYALCRLAWVMRTSVRRAPSRVGEARASPIREPGSASSPMCRSVLPSALQPSNEATGRSNSRVTSARPWLEMISSSVPRATTRPSFRIAMLEPSSSNSAR